MNGKRENVCVCDVGGLPILIFEFDAPLPKYVFSDIGMYKQSEFTPGIYHFMPGAKRLNLVDLKWCLPYPKESSDSVTGDLPTQFRKDFGMDERKDVKQDKIDTNMAGDKYKRNVAGMTTAHGAHGEQRDDQMGETPDSNSGFGGRVLLDKLRRAMYEQDQAFKIHELGWEAQEAGAVAARLARQAAAQNVAAAMAEMGRYMMDMEGKMAAITRAVNS